MTCDFSTLYTTLPHNLIKDRLMEGSLYILSNDRRGVFTLDAVRYFN